MAGTKILAARKALIAAIGILPALDGVKVSYSYVAKLADLANREYVYGGPKSDAHVERSAMKGSARVKRLESVSWDLHVRVARPGQETTEEGDTRAVEIGTDIEEYLAANWTLGGVDGLVHAHIESWSLASWTDEKQSYSELDYRIEFVSYLT